MRWRSVIVTAVIVAGAVSASTLFGAAERDHGDAAAPSSAVQRPSTLFTVEGGPVVLGDPPTGSSGTEPSDCAACHATGDMFRQAVLTVRTGAAHDREILVRYFAQTITEDGRGHLLGQVDDTRVPPPGSGPAPRFSFALDDPQATEVSWSLELFRLAPADAHMRGFDDAAIKVPVSAGRIAIQPSELP
jgi:hypothetical protein